MNKAVSSSYISVFGFMASGNAGLGELKSYLTVPFQCVLVRATFVGDRASLGL
ncbi:hypothetical protein [Fulvivirga kasyanovii]|uniref:hypothetical protein n=1 Tax=Fulvivirga kasyanovii TaxID=396812 RepID=UPI0031D16C1F